MRYFEEIISLESRPLCWKLKPLTVVHLSVLTRCHPTYRNIQAKAGWQHLPLKLWHCNTRTFRGGCWSCKIITLSLVLKLSHGYACKTGGCTNPDFARGKLESLICIAIWERQTTESTREEILCNKWGLNMKNIEIQWARRGWKFDESRPWLIAVKLLCYRDKQMILFQVKKLKGTQI